MPLRSPQLLVVGSLWSLLAGAAFASLPDFFGRLWLCVGVVAAGWAVVAVFASRTVADDASAAPLARLDAELTNCLAAFEDQFKAVEVDAAQILAVLADAVEQLTRSFAAMHASLAELRVPPAGSGESVGCDALREAAVALERLLDAESEARRRGDALAQEMAARVEQTGELVGEVDIIAGQVGLLARNVSVEAARIGDGRDAACAADEVAALTMQMQGTGAQIRAVLALLHDLVGQTRAAIVAVGAQSTADAAALRTRVQRLAGGVSAVEGTPSAGLDGDAAQVMEALQFQDIVGQMVGHLAERIGGMRDALAELGAVAHDAVRARDAEAVGALSERAGRIGQVLAGVAERGARRPVGRGATPGGSVELF